jgi:NAD(P)-dependent dehydrogenase (short-subunit alcohol dehydrogenase family)
MTRRSAATGGVSRVVLITGATGGLGRVVARDLAHAGHRLGLLGTDEQRLRGLVSDLGLATDSIALAAADLRDAVAVTAALDTLRERLGSPDILLHLVGGWSGGTPLVELPAPDLTAMIDQHVWTTFNVTRAAVPDMVRSGWGRIIAVSSPLAGEPTAGMAAYAAGKSAQEALLGSLAADLAGTGVTVNVLRVRTIDIEHERDRSPSAENAGWTTPEEVSAAIGYLCSDEAAVVSGARIPLFGPA